MASTAITTVIKMIESLPEASQEQVVAHLRDYIEDLQDERQWDASFGRTQHQFMAAAQRAKREIAEGRATPMDYDQL